MLPVEWDGKDRLHRFGLHTMGDLASLPVGAVQAQLGREGLVAWELVNGIDCSLIMPYRPEESVSEYLIFPSPAINLDAVVPGVEMLLGRAFARPALSGRYVRAATIECSIYNIPPWTKRFAFKDATNSKDRAMFALKGMLSAMDLPGALEDMRLTLPGITGESGA